MQVVRFDCPYCSASLKIRDVDLVARPVDCPECRQPIVVRLDTSGNVLAGRPNEASAPAKKPAKTPAPAASALLVAAETVKPNAPTRAKSSKQPASRKEPAPARRSASLFSSRPAWLVVSLAGVAAICAVVLAVAFWPRTPQAEAVVGAQASPSADSKSPTQSEPAPGPSGKPAASPAPTPTSRLIRLGELLEQYRKRQRSFPAGTTSQERLRPGERLSWLAELAAASLYPDQPAPLWIEPWNSPRNDRFVRRQIPEFLNPAVEGRVSPQNYPATHFVGVAGVGDDAADLPVDHPRAGVFGNSRTTRLEDIRDGASNTLMVLGVTSDLGSWAAGGSATVRPLTHEPYVNGPDGFGTGSPDRMLVLKADGSVAEMSAATDPRIFRRMAAMSDGLPLNVAVPGEPGERTSRPAEPIGPLTSVNTGGPADGMDSRSRADSPGKGRSARASHESDTATAEASPTVRARAAVVASRPASPASARSSGGGHNPPVDVAAGLSQHIVRFEQAKPVPLKEVLTFLEELLAVSIKGDKHDVVDLDDLLQTPVTFQLENTTVREILKTVLAKAGLTFEVGTDTIHLRKLDSASGSGIH